MYSMHAETALPKKRWNYSTYKPNYSILYITSSGESGEWRGNLCVGCFTTGQCTYMNILLLGRSNETTWSKTCVSCVFIHVNMPLHSIWTAMQGWLARMPIALSLAWLAEASYSLSLCVFAEAAHCRLDEVLPSRKTFRGGRFLHRCNLFCCLVRASWLICVSVLGGSQLSCLCDDCLCSSFRLHLCGVAGWWTRTWPSSAAFWCVCVSTALTCWR